MLSTFVWLFFFSFLPLHTNLGEGNGNPLQYSCLGKSLGQSTLAGYSRWSLRVKRDWACTQLLFCSFLKPRSVYAATAKSLQSCPTLCDPRDASPPGSPIPGILQARTLEWVAISFSNALKWKVKVKSLSHVWLLATPWTAAYQAPPSMGFARQEY